MITENFSATTKKGTCTADWNTSLGRAKLFSETVSEAFSATTKKDTGNTTADWNTTQGKLLLKGGSTVNATNSPGTMADDATVGTVAWMDPNNAKINDNTKATSLFTNESSLEEVSHYLKATNFGFSIPTGLPINGILVEVDMDWARSGGSGPFDNAVRIVKGGTIGTTDKSTGNTWPFSYKSFGSSSDLWGETWTAEDINNSNFGFAISSKGTPVPGSGIYARIDHIRITVYYGYDTTNNIGQSLKLNTISNVNKAKLTATDTEPAGTSIDYYVSNDSGANWTSITSGNTATFGSSGSDFRFKCVLNGTTTATPEVDALSFDLIDTANNIVQSIAIDDTSENILSAYLTKTDSLQDGDSIVYELSNDGGATWETFTPSTKKSFSSTGSDLRFRCTLNGTTVVSPYVDDLSIKYMVAKLTTPANAYSSNDGYATVPADNGNVSISLSKDSGATYQNVITKTFDETEEVLTYGGSHELWGTSWTGDDVDDTSFRLKVVCGTNDGGQSVYKDFGFEIPVGQIINGIEVGVEAKWDGTTTSIDHIQIKIYYSDSVIPVTDGSMAFATDGRKNGEGEGEGTGSLVYFDGDNWIAPDTGQTIAA